MRLKHHFALLACFSYLKQVEPTPGLRMLLRIPSRRLDCMPTLTKAFMLFCANISDAKREGALHRKLESKRRWRKSFKQEKQRAKKRI
jgi:hypothetical protein